MENNETPAWEPPPPPEKIEKVAEPAQMSEVSTLLNIFIEPGRTFEDLRRKPRFILGFILLCILSSASTFALYQKFGPDEVRRSVVAEIERNERMANMPPEQKQGAIDMTLAFKKFMPGLVVVIIFLFVAILSLLYFLGGKAFGGSGGFLQSVSVVVYSSIPPALVGAIAGFIVLAIKAVDEIDLTQAERGQLVQANPSMFIDGKAQPVLAAILSSVDVFQIWGWILAAIGLRTVNKISSTSAWSIVIIFALVGVLLKVVGAFFS